jgi:hypothetical protein
VPNIDCVLFADPKQSTIDIVQSVGRALRPAKSKHCAYVLVPVILKEATVDAFVESKAFAAVLTVLRALAANDERIIAWFRARHASRTNKGGVVEFDYENIAYTIDLENFAGKIETKIWDRLAWLSWRTYDEAVPFVHALGRAIRTGERTVAVTVRICPRGQQISPVIPCTCTAMCSGSAVGGARGWALLTERAVGARTKMLAPLCER